MWPDSWRRSEVLRAEAEKQAEISAEEDSDLLRHWFEARAAGKRGLSSDERSALADFAAAGLLLSVKDLSMPAFGRLGPRAAGIAYLQSYAYIDLLVRRYGERKLPTFYAELIRSKQLDRALSRVYRLDVAGLEAEMADQG